MKTDQVELHVEGAACISACNQSCSSVWHGAAPAGKTKDDDAGGDEFSSCWIKHREIEREREEERE